MSTATKLPIKRGTKVRFALPAGRTKVYGVVTANDRVSEHFATSVWGLSENCKGMLHEGALAHCEPVSDHDWQFVLTGACPSCCQGHGLNQECEA